MLKASPAAVRSDNGQHFRPVEQVAPGSDGLYLWRIHREDGAGTPLLFCGTTAFIPPDCARRDSSALISGIREGECWSSGHAVKETVS
ncbi:hypothetical protein ECZU51_49220 [Escherichia coli]|nr:hypothetical protein ECZU51_49220 [Escherichia coli]